MTAKLSLKDLALSGKRVLMRVDFNVPLDKNATILDDTRIRAALPSIKYVLDHGGSLVLMSHLGRPKGPSSEFSLTPCAKRLSELLGRPVQMAPDCVGNAVKTLVSHLKSGDIVMLENLRFHPAEEDPAKNPNFAKELASLGDCYVDDAFGAAHRAHSSIVEVARCFPNTAAAGFLLEKEIRFIGELCQNPPRPFFAIIGGAKISTKMGLLQTLIKKVDALFIGGGMAFTFLKAQGIEIGDSLCENDQIEAAKRILATAKEMNIPLFLPTDYMIADKIAADASVRICSNQEKVPKGWRGVDIGPATIKLFEQNLQKAKAVIWNGPLGIFEIEPFAKGTEAIATMLSRLQATIVVGGGESVAAVQNLGLADRMTHVSTGGGASLEYLELGTLPGIEALSNK